MGTTASKRMEGPLVENAVDMAADLFFSGNRRTLDVKPPFLPGKSAEGIAEIMIHAEESVRSGHARSVGRID